MVNQAREAVNRGAEEARGYAGSTTGQHLQHRHDRLRRSLDDRRHRLHSFVSARVRPEAVHGRGRVRGVAVAARRQHNLRCDAGPDSAPPSRGACLFGSRRLARPRSSWSTATTSRTRPRSPTTRSCRSFRFFCWSSRCSGRSRPTKPIAWRCSRSSSATFPTQFDFVNTQLDAFRQTRVQLGVAGGLALIWASLGVFGAVTSAVNEAWGVEKQRSFLEAPHGLVPDAGGRRRRDDRRRCCSSSAVQVAQASWFGVMLRAFHWLEALQTLTFTLLGDDPADPRRSASSSTSSPTRRPGFATSGSAPC